MIPFAVAQSVVVNDRTVEQGDRRESIIDIHGKHRRTPERPAQPSRNGL
jgi:hypothetical protein